MMKKTATTPKFQVKEKTSVDFKNITLDGVNALRADEITDVFEVTYELHPISNKPFKMVSKKLKRRTVKPTSFCLVEVTPEELAEYRANLIPSFVLKVDGHLYYSNIPRSINLLSSNKLLGDHMCGLPKHTCKHLSAASDDQGGCAKVRANSQFIEKYPWITTGYETFNTNLDAFVVINCLHYEQCSPRKKLTSMEVKNLRLGLAQFLWDDVSTLSQVRLRKERNKKNLL